MPGHVERDFRASGNGQDALRERGTEKEKSNILEELSQKNAWGLSGNSHSL